MKQPESKYNVNLQNRYFSQLLFLEKQYFPSCSFQFCKNPNKLTRIHSSLVRFTELRGGPGVWASLSTRYPAGGLSEDGEQWQGGGAMRHANNADDDEMTTEWERPSRKQPSHTVHVDAPCTKSLRIAGTQTLNTERKRPSCLTFHSWQSRGRHSPKLQGKRRCLALAYRFAFALLGKEHCSFLDHWSPPLNPILGSPTAPHHSQTISFKHFNSHLACSTCLVRLGPDTWLMS